MKIAVLGAGLAGLSTTWHLLETTQGTIHVDLFDPNPLKENTSSIASGILHPLSATRAKLSWEAETFLEETNHLISIAARYAPNPPVLSKGILRPAITEIQKKDFQNAAKTIKNCKWLNRYQIKKIIPSLETTMGGLLVESAITLDMPSYLIGLHQAITRSGGHIIDKRVTDPVVFENYDKVVIAMGAESLEFNLLKKLPIKLIKGQVLELEWPNDLPPLPFALLSLIHLVMKRDQKSCILGASFEKEFTHKEKDEEKAKQILLKKLELVLPALKDAKILNCSSGIRACTKTHLPYLGRIDDKFWFFTGLCSKGILHHGGLGKLLALALLQDDPTLIPSEIYQDLSL